MKHFSKSLAIVLAIACGLSVGFAFRAWRAVKTSTETSSRSQVNIEATAAAKSPKFSLPPSSALVTKTEADLSFATGVTRWLVWMTAVEKGTLADFPALARIGQSLPGAIRMLAARWIELDPKHLFQSCIAGQKSDGFPTSELIDLLFEEWIKRDPQAAIAALGANAGFESARMNAMNTLMKSDPELALITMSDWHIESYGPNMPTMFEWASKDPRHAAEIALDHPAGYATQLALKHIGAAWAKRDPAAALTFSTEHGGQHASELAAAVMGTWAQEELTKASQWLSAADERTRNQLLPALMESWGRTDPAAALAWCQTNATGSGQKEAVAGLIRGVASKDITSAASLVSSLEPSPVRSQAAGAFAEAVREKEWFPTPHGNGIKTLAPEALAWLNTLDGDSLKSALGLVQYGWCSADPKSLADFLASPAGLPAVKSLALNLSQSLCRISPTEALQWANALPTAQRSDVEIIVYNTWRNTQPEAALDWLTALPTDDVRRAPFIKETALYGINWQAAQVPPETPQQIANLILSDATAARSAISALSIPENSKAALLKLVP